MDRNIKFNSHKMDKTINEIQAVINKNDLNHAEAIAVLALVKFESDAVVLKSVESMNKGVE